MFGDGDLDGGILGSGGDGVLGVCCGLNVEFFEGMFDFKYGFFCFCLMGLEFFFF